jgi:hypothetical protein
MKRFALAGFSGGFQFLWQDREPAAYTRKPSILGETAKLDRAFSSSRNFVDRVGDVAIRDVRFISRIKEDNGFGS